MRFRAFLAVKRYTAMAEGFSKLQATIKMNHHSSNFNFARTRIAGLQQYIKGCVISPLFAKLRAWV